MMSSAPVAMKVNRALAFEHFHERFEAEVALGRRRLVSGRHGLAIVIPLTLVSLRLGQHLALQGGDFHAPWRAPVPCRHRADRISPLANLMPPR